MTVEYLETAGRRTLGGKHRADTECIGGIYRLVGGRCGETVLNTSRDNKSRQHT